jgi:hypothetical protein
MDPQWRRLRRVTTAEFRVARAEESRQMRQFAESTLGPNWYIVRTIEDLVEDVGRLDQALASTKDTINTLCGVAGIPPKYPTDANERESNG